MDYHPQYWMVNGLSFPQTIHAGFPTPTGWSDWIAAHPSYDPFIVGSASTGTKVLLRVINMGYETQPMHVHGFHPKVLGSDQRPWFWGNSALIPNFSGQGSTQSVTAQANRFPTGIGLEKNTITVGSGETYELLFDFSAQQLAGYYPGNPATAPAPTSTFPGGTESRYNSTTNLPVPNTLTGAPEMPDPTAADYPATTYIGGPAVNGILPDHAPGGALPGQFFPFHNHDDYKATNNGAYPGGQFTMIMMLP